MADSLQLSRIAKKVRAIPDFTLPPIPKLPDWFSRQYHFEQYEADWELWRQNAQTQIQDALQAAKELNNLVLFGTGSPEGVVASTPGKIFLNLSGGVGTTAYVKETGNDKTGWNPVVGAIGATGPQGLPGADGADGADGDPVDITTLILSGHGSPEGVQTGLFQGQPYTDLDTAGSYVFIGVPGSNTGWA